MHSMTSPAGAKPIMLAQLELASEKDAKAAAFLHSQMVTKIVIVVHELLTDAFSAIVTALQVKYGHEKRNSCRTSLVSRSMQIVS